ncbi:pilus (MSHA type) biogenesis protein MshL [Methylotenera sp.]|uniref:pilus (MSHA type) biogenesis protein MshL n=1 Tax=Methylotenera sp. TaxID=2051956 RepID=UPI00248A3410|nr:pilus (MSHA type) biogenesis protein MshL [Methylotenera sp.]MDI1363174.1 pilus (MSHA type) biogenesis protein MshL [Methylotenera sp.]
MMLVLGMSACAHQSKITPSNGHIDGQNTAKHQSDAQADSNNPANGKPVTANIPKPVTNNTYLPPPKPKAKAQLYSIVVYDTPVKEVLFAIARDSKLNIDIHPSIQGRVTLNAVDQTLPAILERLSKQVDLTYKIQGDVLTITPDQPVLRVYKVDYVNMSRDTIGFIGADGQISSTSQSSGASGAASSSAGNGANNSSRTSVASESKSHFWDTLEKNLKDILAETDKEILITRIGNTNKANEKTKTGSSAKSPDADAVNTAEAKREKEEDRNEYKTLFAGTVIVNREAGIINVRATNKQHEKIQEFIDKVMGSARKQVLIEATIVEVTLSDGYKAGIDWSRLGKVGSAGFVFSQVLGPQVGTIVSAANITRESDSAGIVAGYVNGNRGILSSVQLLEQFGNTKVLSSPKLMVLNNQTAVLKVVDNLVYFTVQAQQTTGSTTSQPFTTVTTTPNTVPVGVVMSVTPQINDTGNVNINVRPTITSLIRYVPDPNPEIKGNQGIPEIRTREMESLLQISSGNIAVLGGLMQDEIKNNTDSVPGLSRVPGVGKVFQGKNDSNLKTELVIFLRPTVIPNASLESDELAHYKQYLPTQALERASEAEAENER